MKLTIVFLTAAALAGPVLAQDSVTEEKNADEAVVRTFSSIDVDNDGTVSLAELETVPALRRFFAEADADQNGSLNQGEFSELLEMSAKDAGD